MTKVFENQHRKQWTKAELIEYFTPIYQQLYDHKSSEEFRNEVDESVPDYYKITNNPIALCNIIDKLKSGMYNDPWMIVDDFWLMFGNCKNYNGKGTWIDKMCDDLIELFINIAGKVMGKLGFCCAEQHFYEPHILLCNTAKVCVIKSGHVYHKTTKDHPQFVVCDKCYQKCSDSIELVDKKFIDKLLFTECLNDIRESEAFVSCSRCCRKWHHVCAIYLNNGEEFVCKTCQKESLLQRYLSSEMIPASSLSTFIEYQVSVLLEGSNSSKVFIRDFTNTTNKVQIRSKMREQFTLENIDEIEYTSRAVYAFQKIDGVDVAFFALHTQEYSPQCAGPNRGSVYITYIDSVTYFEPHSLRTPVYQQILLSYFDFIRTEGLLKVHLWVCPPEVGNDYVFYRHPAKQKMPKKDRLKSWYVSSFQKGISNYIIKTFNNMGDYYQHDSIKKPSDMPYFDGDYWPTILETMLTNLETELQAVQHESIKSEACESPITPKNKKRKMKSSDSYKRRKLSPENIDEEILFRLMESLKITGDDFMVVELNESNSKKVSSNVPSQVWSCEVFETRDSIIEFCKDNNLEFCTLRRAKFATVKLLNEAFKDNRHQGFYCNECHTKNIAIRYHCNHCVDFDLCNKCYGIRNHEHIMEKIESTRECITIEMISDLLVHASTCTSDGCGKKFCSRIKMHILHVAVCSEDKCKICISIACAMVGHYKACKYDNCGITICMDTKNERRKKIETQNYQRNLQVRRQANVTIKDDTQENISSVIAKLTQLQSEYGDKDTVQKMFTDFMYANPQLRGAYNTIKEKKLSSHRMATIPIKVNVDNANAMLCNTVNPVTHQFQGKPVGQQPIKQEYTNNHQSSFPAFSQNIKHDPMERMHFNSQNRFNVTPQNNIIPQTRFNSIPQQQFYPTNFSGLRQNLLNRACAVPVNARYPPNMFPNESSQKVNPHVGYLNQQHSGQYIPSHQSQMEFNNSRCHNPNKKLFPNVSGMAQFTQPLNASFEIHSNLNGSITHVDSTKIIPNCRNYPNIQSSRPIYPIQNPHKLSYIKHEQQEEVLSDLSNKRLITLPMNGPKNIVKIIPNSNKNPRITIIKNKVPDPSVPK